MKLLAIGSAYVDINCPSFPFAEQGLLPETEVVGSGYEVVLGGSAVNFTRLCAALGLPTAFIGKAGSDSFGEMIQKLFIESGVEPHLIIDPKSQTNISFNMANDLGNSIMAVAGTANQSLKSNDVEHKINEILPNSSHLYVGGCFKQPQLINMYKVMLTMAKSRGITVVLDHGRIPQNVLITQKDEVKALIKEVDYYLPSRDEFLDLWQVGTIEEGLNNLKKISKATVIVKDGSKGAWLLVNGKEFCVPSFSVKPIHPIGAGDSFNAGFIVAQSKGLDIVKCVRYACAVAAIKISRSELPTIEKVDKLLCKN